MILGAFGVIDASPIQVSEALRKLNMSHTFVGGFGRTTHATVDGLCAEQPVWPVIIDRVRNIPKVAIPYDRVVYFVCDARSQLAMSNLSKQLWPDTRVLDLHLAIGVAMVDATQNPGEPWELKVNEPTLDEYVRQAAQPSFMNFLQARACKINPYSLRKEMQKMAVAYLAGGISLLALRRAYRGNSKLADLLTLMESDDALRLRNAVQAARTVGVEAAAQEFNLEQFELNYVLKSYSLNS